ncbi:molybdopterin-dependent oxidoreductase [Undibacterium sp. RTI2.1]|uniref:xanthine dehydrogenase family protein molybdopterin-binding subunit n=1 Tax=unclassified Undibacterium TaxID=2630295 RepID=UPI002AB3D2CE|nr:MULTISPECIES: molybdopterin cofactor-binding domain-containing protein [unclassified Undibacterium]MDY7539068.1 molybdopterin-dependent oxidoreductase [Undibacterium sp. 5I1]MEB0031007.1 molybdopterin-dependent oxidoreductase [Undibacterium sp. RTI2.1]MEB0115854.1 molybdopterin-dependent oxidoreductase [Undibacterium sp. RTI2.2]MEB0229798.1 molybdopterin-dependent oxidoreductase [Undibacterium sp. 10I3]MEB0258297.1 molybdopterin-dependent oxidoreductase [Undibacterium sp. 5I1]
MLNKLPKALSNKAQADNQKISLQRRSFMITAAGAGFTLAFLRADMSFADTDLAATTGKKSILPMFDPTIWFEMDRDGMVTVNIAKAEMGQHVGTALARIVADELEVSWDAIRLHYVDSDPKWGTMVTGGSWSVWQSFEALSRAGAAGRIALIEEGAKLMGASVDACEARDGVVRAGSKTISYADIIRKGNLSRKYSPEQLKAIVLKTPEQRRLIGHADLTLQAIDIPAKTNGSAVYGIDAVIEGMVYARPRLPPTRNGSKVVSIDDSAAKAIKGYIKSIALDDPSDTVPGWVMVFADSFSAANRAAELVNIKWSAGAAATVSEDDIIAHGTKLIADKAVGTLVVADGGVEDAFSKAKQTLEQDYTTSTVLHFQLEPVNAVALFKDSVWHIHTGNQWQSLILPTLAKALGVAETSVILHTYLLGGGFGRRLNGDYAVPAALAAKAMGRPVKMLCTRADDARFDSPRSASIQHVRMAFGENNAVTAMEHHACAGWPTQVMIPAFLAKGKDGKPYDPFSISGADHWYTVGAHRVRAISNDLANSTFRPGWLRSVGPGWTNWAVESFMDEAAQLIKADPLAFRLSMLDAKGINVGSAPNAVGGAARLANVLKRAAEKAGWGSAMPPDTGMGIASTFGQERDMPTWTACVARVKVDRKTGVVKVEKLVMVIDAGTIIHPDGALAQAEGGALWGVSMALHEGTTFVNGEVRDTNLNSYTPLRMADVPEMEFEFISSTETATGMGEPPTTVVGPAIGNAIFAAVGVRMRHLPMRAEAILAALGKKA